MTDNTYCARSEYCKNTDCPRHLNGFNGQYVSKAFFDCTSVMIFDGIKKLLEDKDDNSGSTK